MLTHFHPDHMGGTRRLVDRGDVASVLQSAVDFRQSMRVWGSDDWPERIAEWFVRNGVPRPITDELIEQGHAFAPFIKPYESPKTVGDGADVGGWTIVELPGHADGHICLLRDGVLIAGDHLLAPITPAVGLYPDSRPDPLGDYLASLERTIELAPRIAYGGHGDPIGDPVTRARELIEHHRRRLEETEAALGEDLRTGFEVSRAVFGDRLSPTRRRFAVAEALSHLERLVVEGRARRSETGRFITYTAAETGGRRDSS